MRKVPDVGFAENTLQQLQVGDKTTLLSLVTVAMTDRAFFF